MNLPPGTTDADVDRWHDEVNHGQAGRRWYRSSKPMNPPGAFRPGGVEVLMGGGGSRVRAPASQCHGDGPSPSSTKNKKREADHVRL